MDKEEYDQLTHKIIGAAIEIRKHLGIGLLESAYHGFLVRELELTGLRTLSQAPMPVTWKGLTVDVGYRADLIVEDHVLVELKAVKELSSTDTAQILTYMRLSAFHTGLLLNFHAVPFTKGIKRFVL